MAETIKQELDIEADMVEGRMGELSILVNGEKVMKKGWFREPTVQDFLESARKAIT